MVRLHAQNAPVWLFPCSNCLDCFLYLFTEKTVSKVCKGLQGRQSLLRGRTDFSECTNYTLFNSQIQLSVFHVRHFQRGNEFWYSAFTRFANPPNYLCGIRAMFRRRAP